MKYLLLIALFSATEPGLITGGQKQAPECVAFCDGEQTLKAVDVEQEEVCRNDSQCEAEQN